MEKNPMELYRGWTTANLKKAVTIDRADYEPEALNIIEEELRSRNVSTKDVDSFQKSYLREEEALWTGGNLFCPNCHSINVTEESPSWLRHIPFVRLVTLLLPKYRCDDCGYFFTADRLKGGGAV